MTRFLPTHYGRGLPALRSSRGRLLPVGALLLTLAFCAAADARVAGSGPQLDRELYCMPAGQPALRADGTWGLAVDLFAGQPLADPDYAGAQPAVAVETDGAYVLTCDVSPNADCVTFWVKNRPPGLFDGPYPVCEVYATAVATAG